MEEKANRCIRSSLHMLAPRMTWKILVAKLNAES